MTEPELDEVGYWTEIKLQIIREYTAKYAKILDSHKIIRHFAYIDGFAGAGTHISRETGQEIEGSPAIALKAQPPFSHCHFIDLDGQRAARLRQLAGKRSDVTVYEGNSNDILLTKVFPTVRYEDYARGLCLLDPYNLNPSWQVVQTAGRMKSIEIFLNFMIMDANMNVLRKNPEDVSPAQLDRMNTFWGDDSWRKQCYRNEPGLFGDMEEKQPNEAIIGAYRRRLKEVAGFKYVPEPLPIRNTKGAVVYYLCFASNNETGGKIATGVFKSAMKKYQNRGLPNGP